MINCTYCNIEIIPKKYNVCDNCMTEIVNPLKRKGRGINEKGFLKYKKQVWRLTEINAKKLDGIEKRGWTKEHIDHKYSIFQGFKDGKSIEEISSLSNLRMLNYKDNIAKGIKCI